MKKLLFLLLSCFSLFEISAQNQITGLGRFKLGCSMASINGKYKNGDIPITIEPISSFHDFVVKKNSGITWIDIFQLICDSTVSNPITETSLDKRVSVYYVTKYPITDNIELKEITLKFFKDSLYSIECDDSEQLAEALTLKYGSPKMTVSKKDNQFTYNLTGKTVTKTDVTTIFKWETNNPNVTCKRVIMTWFDDQGKEDGLEYIQLFDKRYDAKIKQEESRVKERIAKRELDNKKKNTEGL